MTLLIPIFTNAAEISKSKETFIANTSICFSQELDLFEKTKGRLPTDDEADLIIDYCVNRKYDEKK